MKKNSRLMSGLLAASMLATMAIPSMAATGIEIGTAGGAGQTPVTVTAEATTFSVVVPTSLPITVDAMGVHTYATDAKIINNSYGSVVVKKVEILGANNWNMVDFTTNMKAEKVNSKKLGFRIGENTATDGTATIAKSIQTGIDGTFGDGLVTWGQINGKLPTDTDGTAFPIAYDAVLPAQTRVIAGDTVSNVTFTIEWSAGEEAPIV